MMMMMMMRRRRRYCSKEGRREGRHEV